MTTQIEVYNTSIRQDSEGRYSLNDLHRAAIAAGTATASHKPSEFLRSAKISEFVDALSKAGFPAPVNSVKGGNSSGTYAHKLVALKYAAWIDPDFEIRVYQTFDAIASGNEMEALKLADTKASRSRYEELKQFALGVSPTIFKKDAEAFAKLQSGESTDKEAARYPLQQVERLKEVIKRMSPKCRDKQTLIHEVDKAMLGDAKTDAIIYQIAEMEKAGEIIPC